MAVIRLFDNVCKLYLFAHVMIAVLFDSQTVLPHSWYSQQLLSVVDEYAKLGDDLVRGAPVWFKSLVWMEISLQIPLSVYLIWAYYAKTPLLRGAALLYSVHVLTTMAPIIAHFATTLKDPHIWCVLSIYSPWIVFPGLMFLRFMFFPTMGAQRFSRKAAVKKKGH